MGYNHITKVISRYLKNSELVIGEEDQVSHTSRVQLGSVFGPTLRNLFYDGVLNVALPAKCSTLAYADDTAIMVKEDSKEDLVGKKNNLIDEVLFWLKKHKPEIAMTKTGAIILRRKRKRDDVFFRMRKDKVHHSNAVRYLGVWIDHYSLANT